MKQKQIAWIIAAMNHAIAISVIEGTRANFFLLKVPESKNSANVWDALLKKGIIVKNCNIDFRGLKKGYIRIDIAPKLHMGRLIDALTSLELSQT